MDEDLKEHRLIVAAFALQGVLAGRLGSTRFNPSMEEFPPLESWMAEEAARKAVRATDALIAELAK